MKKLIINLQSKTKLLFVLIFIMLSVLLSSLIQSTPTQALDWDPGRIIDDAIFTNANTMTPTAIQNFLNSKVAVCDTYGAQPSEYGGGTRAQWGQAKYGQSTFPCLKDYVENGLSSAQIIYNAAQQYQINPQVLIVLLQKEQGLVTDTWPLNIQYRSATGYGCPDTAPCDTQYYGLTNQLGWAAKMFRSIMNNSPGWYTPYVLGNNFIQYNPQSSCGGSNVTIQNRSTQALYNYTPYQPNQGALDAGWGTAPCGAYGNRNFKLYFNNWFGATTNSNLIYQVIKSPDSPALYLQTSAGKYYLPSSQIMADWGLSNLPIQQVSQAYLDSLMTGPWVGNILKDDWNNYFVVENGKLHYVRDISYLNLWNINPNDAVQSLGLAYALKSDSWLGRFVVDANQPDGSIWLINNGKKKLISNKDFLYHWRYTKDQLTTVSNTFLASIPTDTGEVGAYATDGSSSYLIDSGRKMILNSTTRSAYFGLQTPGSYAGITLSFLPNDSVTKFGINSTTGQWYMFEGGRRHYIPNSALAEVWGKKTSEGLTSLSDKFINSTINAGNLAYVVQTASPSAYWLIDGTKKYIADSDTASAWLGENVSPPLYSNESVAVLTQGSNASTKIQATGSNYVYTLNSGIRHYLSNIQTLEAWGGSITQTSPQLMSLVKEGPFYTNIIKSNTGQAYIIAGDKKHPIDPAFYNDWRVSGSTTIVADSTLNRFTTAAALKSFIKIGNASFVVSNGIKIALNKYNDAYKPASLNEVTLSGNYIPGNDEGGFLIKSSDAGDTRIWLINDGKKTLLTFEQQVSFGYLSKSIQPTTLSPATLALIPDSGTAVSYLIQKQNSGVKLLNFGSSLGFPDGQTLTNFIPTSGITLVSNSIFDSIALTGSVSRVVTDDKGKYYIMVNGERHWISNGGAYAPYQNIPRVYLYGTTIIQITQGAAY